MVILTLNICRLIFYKKSKILRKIILSSDIITCRHYRHNICYTCAAEEFPRKGTNSCDIFYFIINSFWHVGLKSTNSVWLKLVYIFISRRISKCLTYCPLMDWTGYFRLLWSHFIHIVLTMFQLNVCSVLDIFAEYAALPHTIENMPSMSPGISERRCYSRVES